MRYNLSTAVVGTLGLFLLFTDHTQADETCAAPAAWFAASGTPQVPDTFEIADDDDECSFYKWGWQSFLWLTQADSAGAGPRFVSFKTPNDLFASPSTPLIALAVPSDKSAKRLLLAMRTSPIASRNVTTVSTTQAGSGGAIVDQNGRAIYYGIHYNDKFHTFVKSLAKKPADIATIDPTKEFPPGCLELKSAWRVLSDEEKEHLDDVRKRFFVIEATVPTLVQITDPSGNVSIFADANQPRDETVALIALHVVGTIVRHPEFIWASFEHLDNAPVLPHQALPNTTPVSSSCYTLYRKNKMIKECNINPVTSTLAPLRLTDPGKQKLTPITDLYRQYNSGDDFESVDDLVDSLNQSVKGQLIGPLSVWKNYQLAGAVWLKDTKDNFGEGIVFGDNVMVGEKRLSNTVMESYTQVSQRSCFACHSTAAETDHGKTIPDMRVKISHILRNAYLFQ